MYVLIHLYIHVCVHIYIYIYIYTYNGLAQIVACVFEPSQEAVDLTQLHVQHDVEALVVIDWIRSENVADVLSRTSRGPEILMAHLAPMHASRVKALRGSLAPCLS